MVSYEPVLMYSFVLSLSWTCIYPIYIDAKRPYGTGTRRISRSKAVWWPLVRDISEALNRLQLRSVIELDKSHPQDWENPGRVRVQWKKEGQLVNSSIKTSMISSGLIRQRGPHRKHSVI